MNNEQRARKFFETDVDKYVRAYFDCVDNGNSGKGLLTISPTKDLTKLLDEAEHRGMELAANIVGLESNKYDEDRSLTNRCLINNHKNNALLQAEIFIRKAIKEKK